MRADRLVAAVLFLQGRTRITAAELATELEVSLATARRDLEALSAANVPVYPQPGRGGGWPALSCPERLRMVTEAGLLRDTPQLKLGSGASD